MNATLLDSACETKCFTETIACPLCNEDKVSILKAAAYPKDLDEKNLSTVYKSSSDVLLMDQLVKCDGCALVYLNPRIESRIGIGSYENAMDPKFVEQDEFRYSTFLRSLKFILNKLKLGDGNGKKILDVGCAGGAFLRAARDLKFETIGVEASRYLCDYGKRNHNLDLRSGTLEQQNFQNGSFDCISMWDVLEHLYYPLETLKHCRQLLNDSGILIINYPDHASFARKLMGFKWPFYLSVHLFYFTPQTVTNILKQAGFTVVSISPHWQTLTLSYILNRAGTYFSVFKWLNKLIVKTPLANLPIRYQLGQTLVIAKKTNTDH